MKHLDRTVLFLLLSTGLALSCKKVTVGAGGGGGSSANAAAGEPSPNDAIAMLGEASEEASAENPEEELGEGEAPASGERFNLTKFIKKRSSLEPIAKYTDEAGTMFQMGDQKFFRIESNGTFGMSPDFNSSPEERKVMGAFWMKAYAADRLLTNAANESGLFVDMGAEATLDKLNIDMHFRYVGVDIATRSVLAGFDQSFMRDFELDANFVPVVKASAKVGGEVGMKGEFGIRRDNVVNLMYTPRANMLGGIQVGVDIIVAGVFLVGEIKLMDLVMKGAANVGLVKETGLLYSDIGLDKNELKLVSGKLDIVTNLFKHEVRRDKVWHPDPIATITLPTFGSTYVKFLKKPVEGCKTATDRTAVTLALNLKKMKEYEAVAPEEDKGVVQGEIKRLATIYQKALTACK
jgi:hypothetical protein